LEVWNVNLRSSGLPCILDSKDKRINSHSSFHIEFYRFVSEIFLTGLPNEFSSRHDCVHYDFAGTTFEKRFSWRNMPELAR